VREAASLGAADFRKRLDEVVTWAIADLTSEERVLDAAIAAGERSRDAAGERRATAAAEAERLAMLLVPVESGDDTFAPPPPDEPVEPDADEISALLAHLDAEHDVPPEVRDEAMSLADEWDRAVETGTFADAQIGGAGEDLGAALIAAEAEALAAEARLAELRKLRLPMTRTDLLRGRQLRDELKVAYDELGETGWRGRRAREARFDDLQAAYGTFLERFGYTSDAEFVEAVRKAKAGAASQQEVTAAAEAVRVAHSRVDSIAHAQQAKASEREAQAARLQEILVRAAMLLEREPADDLAADLRERFAPDGPARAAESLRRALTAGGVAVRDGADVGVVARDWLDAHGGSQPAEPGADPLAALHQAIADARREREAATADEARHVRELEDLHFDRDRLTERRAALTSAGSMEEPMLLRAAAEALVAPDGPAGPDGPALLADPFSELSTAARARALDGLLAIGRQVVLVTNDPLAEQWARSRPSSRVLAWTPADAAEAANPSLAPTSDGS